jgi:hypothetical protein
VSHDVENYLGVVERRGSQPSTPLGYSIWWLTLDRVAFQVEERIKAELGQDTPPSPVMSADFLVNYLSVGPSRSSVSRAANSILPVILDVGLMDGLTPDLIYEAQRIRRDSGNLPEHVIRRRVRDHLDAAKRRRGRVFEEGVGHVLDQIGRVED